MTIELIGDFTPTPITYLKGDFMEFVWAFIFISATVFGFFVAVLKEGCIPVKRTSPDIPNPHTTHYEKPKKSDEIKPKPKPKTFDENDWQEICEAAVEKAKTGDARSRDWVLENIFNKSEQGDTKTSKEIVEDCTWALINYGYKKADAIKLVNEKVADAEYTSVEELLKDIFKKG